jgi:transcriptional regulator with XRE-family HTH domain
MVTATMGGQAQKLRECRQSHGGATRCSAMDVERFSDRLRSLRLDAGLTQKALANRSGLSVRGISDLERGLKHRPHPATVQMLAAALGVPPQELAPPPPTPPMSPPKLPTIAEPQTPLVGRERELREVQSLLRPESGVRLLTLLGPGGVGKTRLALRVAALERDRAPEGAVFVSLAGLRDPALVIPALTAALGIRHRSDRTASELLEQRLRDQRVLAVLDNFEHLMAAAPELAMLLRRCPGLSILATSRSPLRIA